MTEAARRYDAVHANAFLAPRSMPVRSITSCIPNCSPMTTAVQTYGGLGIFGWTMMRTSVQPARVFDCIFVDQPVAPKRSESVENFERARRELERLKDGWAGPGSVAPSEKVLADFDKLLTAIPSDAALPEIEVDSDAGHVTLRWTQPGATVGFSLLVKGNGRTLAVKTLLGPNPIAMSKSLELGSGREIVERFLESDLEVAGALRAA